MNLTHVTDHDVPLAGLRVVDLSRVLAGPYCAQLLADMGAEVIKVESPEGDECRHWPPFREGDDVSTNFGSVNRGKLGMAIDLKSAAAVEVLPRLIEWGDVVIHNFLPATAKRLGVDYQHASSLNPRIVFLSLSGYGALGPLAGKNGYDLMMQAFSGAMGMTGYEDSGPVRIGVSFIDMATGMAAYGAVMTALYARARTGRGTHARVSLLETAVALLGHHVANWFEAGMLSTRQGSAAGNLSPYQAFACSDGHLVVGATNDRMFRKLCDVLDRLGAAEDERFATNALRVTHRAALNAVLAPCFAARTVADWTAILDASGIPSSAVQTVDRVMEHPQVIAKRMIVEVDRADGSTARFAGVPFKLADHPGPTRKPAPHRAEHTRHVLHEVLGFPTADVERLMSCGAR